MGGEVAPYVQPPIWYISTLGPLWGWPDSSMRPGAFFGVAVGAGGPDALDQGAELVVARAVAERGLEVGSTGGEEAGEEMAVG